VGPEDLKVNLIVLEGKARQDYLRESKVILLVLKDLEGSKAVVVVVLDSRGGCSLEGELVDAFLGGSSSICLGN
jgi:hypothetical protein